MIFLMFAYLLIFTYYNLNHSVMSLRFLMFSMVFLHTNEYRYTRSRNEHMHICMHMYIYVHAHVHIDIRIYTTGRKQRHGRSRSKYPFRMNRKLGEYKHKRMLTVKIPRGSRKILIVIIYLLWIRKILG